jgi:hypothetical protein
MVVKGALAAAGTVLVHGDAACRSLHAWNSGAFGELLIVDEAAGKPVSYEQRKTVEKTSLYLRLRAAEAYFLAVEVQPPRLAVTWPDPSQEGVPMVIEGAEAIAKDELWDALLEGEPMLPQLYATYTTLRAAGWKIRDGLKFGFDFMLYDAAGSSGKHAYLGALVLTPDAQGEQRNWLWLQRHARVCHSVGKGLLMCNVEPDSSGTLQVRTMRIDGWSLDRQHARISDERHQRS